MKSTDTRKIKSSSLQEAGKIKKTATPKKVAEAPAKSNALPPKKVKKTAAKSEEAVPKASAGKTAKRVVKFDKKITDKLKKIVANYTEYPELLDNIERNTTKSFIDELNIDSVDFVEIIVDVEQAFNITIKDEEIYQLKSFEDLYVAIEEKINETRK